MAGNHKTGSGFSLVELLAVVAIIALLLALVLPASRELRERARQAACAGNLKAQGTGLLARAASFDGYLTRWKSVDDLARGGAPYGGWSYHGWFQWAVNTGHSAMLSYYQINNEFACASAPIWNDRFVRDQRAFYCPGDPVRKVVPVGDPAYGNFGFFKYADGKVGQSYWFNPAQAFRTSVNTTTRVGGGYGTTEYPFKYGRRNAILLMDPVAPGGNNHRSVWMTFDYDGGVSRRGSDELADRLQLLDPGLFGNWNGFDNHVLPLLAK